MCVWAIPLAMMAVSAVSSAMSAQAGAKAQNSQMDYNAATSLNNAQAAREESNYARAQAQRNASEKRKETGVLIGAQRAKMGASGAVVDSGSFLDLPLSTREEGEKDAMALVQQGDMEAWRSDLRAGQYEEQARIYRGSKKNTDSVLAGSLLSGAAQVGMSYFSMSGFGGGSGGADAAAGTASALGAWKDNYSDN